MKRRLRQFELLHVNLWRVSLCLSIACMLCWHGEQCEAQDASRREEALILAQLEDLPAPGDSTSVRREDGRRPTPTVAENENQSAEDDDTPTIELSDEDDIFDDVEVVPLCTTEEAINRGIWYTNLEFVYLFQQPLKNNFTLATDTSASFDNEMTTNNFKLRWRPGTRITLGRDLGLSFLDQNQSIEVTYFGLFDWFHETSLSGPGGAATVTTEFLSGFLPANTIRGQYQTQLNSIEINLRVHDRLEQDRLIMAPDGTWSRQCKPGFLQSFFAGVRVIKFDQEFVLSATRDVAGSGYQTTQKIATQNDMFGVHLGTEWIHQDCRWNWGMRFKLGAMINDADQQRRDFAVFEGGGTAEFEQIGSDDQLAIEFDAGIFAEYHLHPGVTLRASYDALWLHGVAEAPDGLEDFGFGLSSDIDANENGIFHGLSLGLEMRW